MATLIECLAASSNDTLKQKIRFACVIAAEKIRTEDVAIANHAQRLAWAKQAFMNPEQVGNAMVGPVVAQNWTFTLAQIVGASDAAVQDAVDKAVNVFVI